MSILDRFVLKKIVLTALYVTRLYQFNRDKMMEKCDEKHLISSIQIHVYVGIIFIDKTFPFARNIRETKLHSMMYVT